MVRRPLDDRTSSFTEAYTRLLKLVRIGKLWLTHWTNINLLMRRLCHLCVDELCCLCNIISIGGLRTWRAQRTTLSTLYPDNNGLAPGGFLHVQILNHAPLHSSQRSYIRWLNRIFTVATVLLYLETSKQTNGVTAFATRRLSCNYGGWEMWQTRKKSTHPSKCSCRSIFRVRLASSLLAALHLVHSHLPLVWFRTRFRCLLSSEL